VRRFDGVIFDMDGTLIEQSINFLRVSAELGVPASAGILETLDAMDPDEAESGRRLLLDHELAGVRKARLMPGAREILTRIRDAGIKTALLTRNAGEAMAIVLERFGLRFDLAWSREDGPIKPEPDGVLRACAELGIEPARTASVGDFHYDLVAANAAGALSILFAPEKLPEFADLADRVITDLAELGEILEV